LIDGARGARAITNFDITAASAEFGNRPTGEIQDADGALPAIAIQLLTSVSQCANIIGSNRGGRVFALRRSSIHSAQDGATTLIESSRVPVVHRVNDHEIPPGIRLGYGATSHIERSRSPLRPMAAQLRNSADPPFML